MVEIYIHFLADQKNCISIDLRRAQVNELSVPKPLETVFNADDDCHNDCIDCDLIPGVTLFRRLFIYHFIFEHLNINSYRHKYISIRDILAKKHVDYLAISESKLDAGFPSA